MKDEGRKAKIIHLRALRSSALRKMYVDYGCSQRRMKVIRSLPASRAMSNAV